MSNAAQRQLDSLAEFLAAVEYVAALDRPSLTVWGAVAEALGDWLGEHSHDERERDPLRRALIHLIEVLPEDGAPGGHPVSEVLDAAAAAWAERAAGRLNDGHSFRVREA